MFRFTLEPYKGINSRHQCPGCRSQEKTFVLYIDIETGKKIHPTVGRCNRLDKCGYHLPPKQYFQNNNISFETSAPLARPTVPAPRSDPFFIDSQTFKKSLLNYDSNNFITFLITLFDAEITAGLIEKYFLGTSAHWPGSTTFWQIDSKGKIRDRKIIQYAIVSEQKSIIGLDCKRVKTNYPPVQWVHSVTKYPEFELKQCLFGEHLLKDTSRPVAIVESEKTAVIASVYLPQFIWLASGGLEQLSFEKFIVLSGRKVVLFPDLNGFAKWKTKATGLAERISGIRLEVSDLLERSANEEERASGLDLADYLIRFNFDQFRMKPTADQTNVAELPKESYDPSHWVNGLTLFSSTIDYSKLYMYSLPY
ncbi:MAG: DUF6371 domain-containing protein [Mariniphaga sp.]